MLVFACLMHTKRIISTGEGENPVVTERNSPVTLRPFTVTGDPVYDEAAKSTETVFLPGGEVIIMTFGEKLKEARKEAGLSQEAFAEKMSVSRSAVAKWEAGGGMPDITNLKVMAQLLDVSIDYLLDEDEKLSFNETKEAVDLDSLEVSGKCRDKKDAACYSRFPGADAIYPLIRKKRMRKGEWLADLIAGPGIIQGADYLNDASAYYLVETGGKQLLVNVSAEFLTSRELANKVNPGKFDFGDYTFRKAPYRLI